jgi:hypothetical protein
MLADFWKFRKILLPASPFLLAFGILNGWVIGASIFVPGFLGEFINLIMKV